MSAGNASANDSDVPSSGLQQVGVQEHFSVSSLPVADIHSDKKPRATNMFLRNTLLLLLLELFRKVCLRRLRAGTRPMFPMKPGTSPKIFGKM